MTQPEMHHTPEAFLTPKFYDAMRAAGGVAIAHNLEAIHGLNDFLYAEAGRKLPAPVEQTDFAYYLTVKSKNPFTWDKHYADAKPNFSYIRNANFPELPNNEPFMITKTMIAARSTHITEIQIPQNGVVEAMTLERRGSLSGWLARTALIAVPGSSDTRLIASPDEWLNQGKRAVLDEKTRSDALDAGHMLAEVGNKTLEAEAARRFPNAVMITS